MELYDLITKLEQVENTFNLGTEHFFEDGIIYVKGTDDLRDWLVNIYSWDKFSHQGFFDEASMLLCKYEAKDIKLIVGHSAGAAVGQQLGYILNVPCIGFGCPRHFNRKRLPLMARYCDLYTINFDLAVDPVTFVPPWFQRGNILQKGNKIGHSLAKYKRVFGHLEIEIGEDNRLGVKETY